MLAWYPERRATAQEMLAHPWLNSKGAEECKYTDKEYEVMMLKKEIKQKMTKTKSEDEPADMGELVESD